MEFRSVLEATAVAEAAAARRLGAAGRRPAGARGDAPARDRGRRVRGARRPLPRRPCASTGQPGHAPGDAGPSRGGRTAPGRLPAQQNRPSGDARPVSWTCKPPSWWRSSEGTPPEPPPSWGPTSGTLTGSRPPEPRRRGRLDPRPPQEFKDARLRSSGARPSDRCGSPERGGLGTSPEPRSRIRRSTPSAIARASSYRPPSPSPVQSLARWAPRRRPTRRSGVVGGLVFDPRGEEGHCGPCERERSRAAEPAACTLAVWDRGREQDAPAPAGESHAPTLPRRATGSRIVTEAPYGEWWRGDPAGNPPDGHAGEARPRTASPQWRRHDRNRSRDRHRPGKLP